MEKAKNIAIKILNRVYSLTRIFGRGVSVAIFSLIIGGIVYFYMKDDLPPQEIWTIVTEFSPGIADTTTNIVPNSVFEFVNIDPSNNKELIQVDGGMSTMSVDNDGEDN